MNRRKFIVNTPHGTQEIIETEKNGGYFDESRIFWCYKRDGEPPIDVELGHMERIEVVEPVKHDNGKQKYYVLTFGEHKSETKKVPMLQRVVYLRNTRTGKKAKSKIPPKLLPPQISEE